MKNPLVMTIPITVETPKGYILFHQLEETKQKIVIRKDFKNYILAST